MMIDAEKYNITVRKGIFDDEELYEAKIKELPDVSEYADSHAEAYSLAIDTIQTTAEIFEETGRVMPAPIIENDGFSGRVTLRMPKSMHASFSSMAIAEAVSLNQLLVSNLAYSLGHVFGYKDHFDKCVLGAEKFTEFFSLANEKQAALHAPISAVNDYDWEHQAVANEGYVNECG